MAWLDLTRQYLDYSCVGSSFDITLAAYSSHQTSILDARVQVAHAHSYPAVASPKTRAFPWLLHTILLALDTLQTRRNTARTTGRVRRKRCRGRCYTLQGKDFHYPFIPDLAVVRLAVHGGDDLAALWDVEWGLKDS